MRLISPVAALVACLPASVALADTTGSLALSYDIFEVAVPHVDLESCPADLAAENVFCRATLANEELHVFAFSIDGDSPLVGFASYDAVDLPKLLN